jgi:peptidoglycan/LPS O-acetylase OafA/YrhL
MTAPAPQRFEVLDAWRGICACLVALVHVPVAHQLLNANAFHNMQLFVDFFFVLSGFVICHAYGQRLTDEAGAVNFMIRRFGRVWPLHAAILAGFLVIELAKFAASFVVAVPLDGVPFAANHSWPTLVSNLLLTQAFNLHGMTSWNSPAWSIGVEFYTYAVFAVVVLVDGPRRSNFAGFAALGLLGVVTFSPDWLFTTHDFGMFRCLYGFFLGCLVYEIRRRHPVIVGTRVETLALATLGVFLLATGRDASSLAAPLIFASLVYVFAAEQGAISRTLHTKAAQALGLWSYSIYIVHMLVYAVLKIVLTGFAKVSWLGLSAIPAEPVKLWTFSNPVADWALVALHLALTLWLARWTYEHIELPGRAWFAKLAGELTAGRAFSARARHRTK